MEGLAVHESFRVGARKSQEFYLDQVESEMRLDIYGDSTMIHKLEFREEMELTKAEIIIWEMKFITMALDNAILGENIHSG